MSDKEKTSRSSRVDRLVREAYEDARDFDWELALDDVLPGVKRRTRGRARGRIGVVLVAAAIILVFFVPLPHMSLFNRLSNNNVKPGGSSTVTTPAGWVPVAYGNAQISVPSNWKVEYEQACWFWRTPGTVAVGPGGNGLCPPYGGRAVPFVALGPRPALVKVTSGRRESVNGLTLVRYLHSAAETSYFVPILDVTLTLMGEGAQRVLRTLTESPRAVVLAPGPPPQVPPWHRITFAGISVAVPASWPITRFGTYGPPCGDVSPVYGTTGVFLDTDSQLAVSHCGELGYSSPKQATDGLSIDRIPTQFFPATAYGECLKVHGLTACPATAYPYSVLVLSVTVPGRSKPVVVSIGLAGNGTVARTILYSLRPAAASSSTGSGNTWRADWTSVNPGAAISFATTQVGWRLDGQPNGPNIDDNLGSGIVDNGSAWPGTSISVTNNGGRTWSTILRVSTGIWGFDLVSRQVGFAVGVSTLLRTTDSGQRWTPVGEPAGHSLVWVGFGSATHGYGLTTTGTLVVSEDGGSSWTPTNLKVKGSSACFASPSVGYVVDSAGALYATRDGGTSWVVAKNAPPRVEQFIGPWSYLSCDGSNVWVGLRLDCAAACGASSPYVVEHSSDGGILWSSTANEWPGASRSVGPIANLADVGTSTAHGGIAVDLPTSNSPPWTWRDIRIIVYTDEGSTYQEAKVPALPETYSLAGNYVNIVRGVSFIGSTGWLYFDYTRAGSSNHPAAEPIIWRTSNGGSTWTVLATGPKQAPPPLS